MALSDPSYDDLRESRDGWKRDYEAKEAEVGRLRESERNLLHSLSQISSEVERLRALLREIHSLPSSADLDEAWGIAALGLGSARPCGSDECDRDCACLREKRDA